MTKFERLFPGPRTLIGMVHLLPLPGSPGYGGKLDAVTERAVREARLLEEAGFDGVLVENYGDTPFLPGPVGPETVAAMTAVAQRVVDAVEVPVGVNVLRNDALSALAVANAVGARFLRVNVHTGAAVTDQGILEGRAFETLRERRRLGADVLIFADILVKHGAPLGSSEPRQAAEEVIGRGKADAVLVTGNATGRPPDMQLLCKVAEAVPDSPVLVASGLDASNAGDLLRFAHGGIVGSSLKRGGKPTSPVDRRRAARFLGAAR